MVSRFGLELLGLALTLPVLGWVTWFRKVEHSRVWWLLWDLGLGLGVPAGLLLLRSHNSPSTHFPWLGPVAGAALVSSDTNF